MASQFIGYNVLVTLKAPPDATVQGEVADVIGQRLMLRNVKLSWNHQVLPSYFIDATDIADLSLGSAVKGQSQNLPAAKGDRSTTQAAPATQQQFVDPAILSFSKPPSKPISRTLEPENRPLQPSLPNEPTVQQPRPPQVAHAQPAAVLTEPFSSLELNVDGKTGSGGIPQVEERRESVYGSRDELTPLQTPSQYAAKRSRRTGQKKTRQGGYPNAVNEHDGASNTNPKTRGWRQTAFVEPSDPHLINSPQPHAEKEGTLNGRRRKKKNRGSYVEDPSGWATEDATDIQELGEFDFQSNLSKFDKRRVFEEIRNDDTTADEARLVSFNRRVPKPGTNGGKNLHWTENVLDSPQESENEASEHEPSDAKLSSGTYSGRELSKARGQTSRKGSALLGQPLVPPQLNTIGRGQLSSSRTTSPRPNKTPVSASPIGGPGASGVSLRLTTTNRSCPTVSPLQTLEVEQIAVTELGLTEDMITENAGRGIAEAAVGLLTNDAAAPTILVLTGNHRTGARAISAARHLRNRGHRVTACMLGIEHENELLESCRKQLDVFKKIGGRVLRWEDLSARLSTSDFSPDLVVDALFGVHIAFDDLRTDDQATAFEMISWTNRSNLEVLSVDVPSGLSASSGEVTIVEGGRLCVNSKSVVCLGAPKTGVVQALVLGEGLSWNLSVADIGVPQIVWRKYGTRRRHGIDFGNRWVVPLRFQASTA
ncbi:mRNA decapping enhancer EDC3 [Aspergillus melleus]|uniref:mRNA decapping enhancer EDC3 n=1 Tax=Aspergillus melleus TaxID=138277 RepID=UPI001E8D3142|nr:enhancer of mRNA decapping [Aspergillus melleus]KAH8425233.1 enhancer of mRNA decapping [Aspergillus melleus]